MAFDNESLSAAAQSGPGLDPQSLVGIATASADPSEASQNAAATQAYAAAQKAVNQVRSQDAGVQRKVWGSLKASEQAMWTSIGYHPPKQAHRSLFSRVTNTLADVTSAPLDAVGHVATAAVGEGLHYLAAGERQVQHAYRAGALITDQNVEAGRGQFSFHGVFSPSEWADAWRHSKNGEQTFLPSHVARITKQYGDETVALARQLAGGRTPDQVILALPEDQRAAMASRLQSDTNLHDATRELQNAKISFGRRLVGESNLNGKNRRLAHLVAGTTDATFDILSDPVIVGGKLSKGLQELPYIAHNADAVGQILEKPGAQRLITAASDALHGGDAAELIRRFPKFTPIAQQLVDEGVNTPEAMTEWFKGVAGRNAILEGKVGGFAHGGGVLVPNISRTGLVGNQAKVVATKVIDFGADSGIPGLHGTGTFVKRLTRQTVQSGSFNADSENALRDIQRIADYALPRKRADEVVNMFAHAPDLGTQRNVYKGLIGEVFDRLGVPQSYKDNYFSVLDEAHDAAYGVGDRMVVNGQEQSVGFLEPHLQNEWAMPNYRELRSQASRNMVVQALYGTINGDLVTKFMDTWKPASLLRMGFPIRSGGEEAVGAALREGPLSVLRGRLADSALADGKILPYHPIENAVERLTRHLPDSVAKVVHTPADLAGEVFGDRARRAFRYVEGRFAGKEYVQGAKEIAALHDGALPDLINATETRGAGYLADSNAVARMAAKGVTGKPAYLTPGPEFIGYGQTDTLYTHMWQKRLDEIAQSRIARPAIDTADQGVTAQIDAVVERLKQDDMTALRGRATRNMVLQDGHVVGVNATEDEALTDWARVVVDNVNHLTSDAAGNRIPAVHDVLKAGRRSPDITVLDGVPDVLRPPSMSGPEMLPVHGEGKWEQITNRGFEHIGRMMNWIAREPIFTHNYVESKKELEGFRAGLAATGLGPDAVEQRIREMASTRALEKTVPFIHDPHLRSQFAEDGRNLMPFWFAQEQFYKRWAKTLAHSPEAFREAQLTMSGMRHSGIVKKDAQGNDFFMYPGAGAVQQALSKVAELVTGHQVSLPLPVGFSGQVRFATPGTERLGVPSFGPLVAVPMGLLSKRFPELEALNQSLAGERGAGRSAWEQVLPTTMVRAAHALFDNPETSPQMHSAVLQTIQYLEATGHGLPEGSSALEQEHYLDRIKSWARVLMVNRLLFGFSAPAAPELQLDPSHLHEEFSKLLGQLPIDEAQKEFMRRHPDANAYTVFQSKSVAGAPLPATAEAVKFMQNNAEFLKQYPEAGAWFLPQTPGKGFDPVAFREQMGLEMRKRKTTDEFYRDIKFTEAAGDYFDTKDARDAALAAAGSNSAQKAQINQRWAAFSKPFLKMHPVFAEELQSPEGKIRRGRALDQLRQAVVDARLPGTPQNAGIRDLVDTYDAYLQARSPFEGRTDGASTRTKQGMKAQFIGWAHQYVQEHPEVAGVYDRVFRLEVGDSA